MTLTFWSLSTTAPRESLRAYLAGYFDALRKTLCRGSDTLRWALLDAGLLVAAVRPECGPTFDTFEWPVCGTPFVPPGSAPSEAPFGAPPRAILLQTPPTALVSGVSRPRVPIARWRAYVAATLPASLCARGEWYVRVPKSTAATGGHLKETGGLYVSDRAYVNFAIAVCRSPALMRLFVWVMRHTPLLLAGGQALLLRVGVRGGETYVPDASP